MKDKIKSKQKRVKKKPESFFAFTGNQEFWDEMAKQTKEYAERAERAERIAYIEAWDHLLRAS